MGRRRSLLIVAVLVLTVVVVALVAATRLVTYERHRGYFGPAWSADGRIVYCFERVTHGFTWGPGWEFFSPPASAWVVSDVVSLCAIEVPGGRKRVLERIPGGPVQGRLTRNYRNRIFGILDARIDATRDTVRYVATVNLPRVPSSDPWHVRGTWPRASAGPKWRNEWVHEGGLSEPVLFDDREVLVTDGAAAYPAAILIVNADRSHAALARTAEFDVRYRGGVPPQWIEERSRRNSILRAREFERVHGELVRELRSRGLSEVEAALGASDRMQDLGYLSKDPVVVARPVDGPTPGEPVFEIPSSYFEVGLFKDISAAVTAPGESVETSTGDYLKYYDDDVGPRLRDYRATRSSFVVRVNGRMYRLDVVKP